jgi:signal transduction histidine kinase
MGASWLPIALVAEAGALFILVMWNKTPSRLGAWFLPLALGWFLVASIVEQAIVILALPPEALARFGREGLPGVGIEAIFLAVPVILATWQYGRRGFTVTLATLAVGFLILAPLISRDPAVTVSYVVASLGRLTMIALLGYIVLQLVNGLRAEHRSLAAANRQLAQRAATVQQLAESRERNRLARELHDTLAHSLTALSVQLQAIETLQTYDPQAAGDQLKQAQTTVRSGIQESRRAIQALRATPLEELGLAEALRQLCRRYVERTETALACDVADVETLDPLTEQAIYRVAEAALANVERHAAADQVSVRLGKHAPSGNLRLEISDNGAGFDRDIVIPDRFGLTGMAEWAELAGAGLHIDTAPGQGTRVVLEMSP